jgi:hypothetical protein
MTVDAGGSVVSLGRASTYRPDVAVLARQRFGSSRRASGLAPSAFAVQLADLLGWPASAQVVAAWEKTGVPPGDVMIAADLLARERTAGPHAGASILKLLADYGDLQEALGQVVGGAQDVLAITGSRSRDPDHLERIEAAVVASPRLVHYRVLYGPPRHAALKSHLLRLVDLHRPAETLHIGLVHDLLRDGERFICGSEQATLIVLPSLNAHGNFDTGLLIVDTILAGHYVQHVRQAFLSATPLSDRVAIEALDVVR